MLNDELYAAPIGDNPQVSTPFSPLTEANTRGQRILDIGTGTGIWAMSVTNSNVSRSSLTGS